MADNKQQSGFALLISLIVVGVVLSIGLVILDLTIKQVQLAATTKDSEIAFHAANAGMECARFWRRSESAAILAGSNLTGVTCFGQASDPSPVVADSVPTTGGGVAWQYEYDFSWGTPVDRCTKINNITVAAPALAPDTVVALAELQARIPGYPGSANIVCPAGSQCTTISVKGYNQACPSGGGNFGFGVVERQVLLEF